MIHWKDSTSYSQTDKERIPGTWMANINGYEVIVTRHILNPNVWFFRSRTLGIDLIELHSKYVEHAKREAILLLKNELLDRVGKMQEALGAIRQYQNE